MNNQKTEFKEVTKSPPVDQSVEQRLKTVMAMSDQQLRLMAGEMTAQEIRTVRAVLNYIATSKGAT